MGFLRIVQVKQVDASERFFAPVPRGLETLLASELEGLGAMDVEPVDGGVGFSGPFSLCYRTNLESRLASRILWRVGGGRYRTENDVYQRALNLPWPEWFDVQRRIAVKVSAIQCPLRSLDFITLKIKDAICDRFRRGGGVRPDVDTHSPDVRIHAFLDANSVTFYIDTSGAPLFQRGQRHTAGEAPLRENLAAGILQMAGWDPTLPLLDPMCGSGTFLLEAASMALDVPPGMHRSFAFEALIGFDPAAWSTLKEEAAGRRRSGDGIQIFGSDLYGDALKHARANVEAAGLGEVIHLKQANVLEIGKPAEAGVLVTNPPYGVRLGELDDLARFYPELGDALKQKFSGWTAYIFTADLRLPKLIGLKPSRRIPLYNGPLECRLYEIKLVTGRPAPRSTPVD